MHTIDESATVLRSAQTRASDLVREQARRPLGRVADGAAVIPVTDPRELPPEIAVLLSPE